jgi:hypothetical protein
MIHTSYVHHMNHRGGVCLAYEPTTEHFKDRSVPVVYKVTSVFCHPKDDYTKKTGRMLADENLAAGQFIYVRVPPYMTPREFFWEMAENIS